MKSRRGGNDPCFCPSCLYKHKAYTGIERTGSKIDKLYRDKYLPLRESKLIDKLERTRAVYDDIRAPPLVDSISNKNITNRVRRDHTGLDCCNSCCGFTRKGNKKYINKDTDVSSDYGFRKSSKRRVRFKSEFIKSDPCVCLAKFGSLLKKHTEFVQSKLKRDSSVPLLTDRIKEEPTIQRSQVGKVFQIAEKVNGPKGPIQEMLKSNVKRIPKSREKVHDFKHKNNYEGSKNLIKLDPRLCPCPQEKLVLKIRKDSIRKFYDDLEKKRTLKHLECKSECIQDVCIPKECLDKIKLSKQKSRKKHKTSQKQKKSLKDIVSNASRRKKKKSVMCQCDEASMPIMVSDKQHITFARQNKVKFVTSKKGIRDKSDSGMLYRLHSKTSGGNTLKRCFCTLKFKPLETENKSKYSSPLHYNTHSGQSGDMIVSSTNMNKTLKRTVKSKSNCTVYDCDPNECLKDNTTGKKYRSNLGAKKSKNQPSSSHMLNAADQPKPDIQELDQDNRRVLRVGSSISFNIEFFKENTPKDTHKSVKTSTIPHYISNKSIKSIPVQKSNKLFTKHKNKRKVTMMDNLKKDEDLNLNKNLSAKLLKNIKKFANSNSKNKIKYDPDILLKNAVDIESEMVDRSTKITSKDMRLMKTYECKPHICAPDNCDPYLCLGKRNKHITTTDFPKMISVASGIHKRKYKNVRAQSKRSFRKRKSLDKFDQNILEESEDIHSNVLPKMSTRNTLRLSSKFSFAIEIAKVNKPPQTTLHKNPIETSNQNSSIYKAKKIKSRINNDNYTHRNNKSKNSVINTMVKRCMCTLNLSKQRNKNNSHNKVKEHLNTNVYTVNTVMINNIGAFSKGMSKKIPPRVLVKLSPNEYKNNNLYTAWHSQIICNYMQVSQSKTHLSKKTLREFKIERQHKNKLWPISKSLSFISDKELKKNVNSLLCHYAESKSITFYESSDYISKLYRNRRHPLTKSSKYWKNSYCTMNLMTNYNRNNNPKKQIPNDSQPKCRIGSNINLNIEFYKANSCLEPKLYVPTAITRKDNSLKSKMTQDVMSTSNKQAVSEDQRCFCTLKLQKKIHAERLDHSKQKSGSVINLKSISHFSRSQNTSKIKRLKNISNDISTTEKEVNTIRLPPKKRLVPHECFPDMCVPGYCDPASCYEKLYKRKLKTRSISAATKNKKKKVLAQQSSVKNTKTQSNNIQSHTERNEQTHKRTVIPYNNIDTEKQCAKFGSNMSFSIEFYKENSPSAKRVHRDQEVCDKKYIKSSKYADASLITKTLSSSYKKLSSKPHGSLIKRCFCTLKLQKKQKIPSLTGVHSIGVMAGVKNKWYSDKVLSNQVNMHKGDVISVYNTENILKKYNNSVTGEKEAKSKHEKQHTVLLPYECKPGTCVPGTCDPYECLQRIKGRKMIKRDIGSVTTRLKEKSLGTSSRRGSISRHRRIQTVSFQQNDKHFPPKRAKQKYDERSSNNQCVRIGSNINFSIEFFKDKNCEKDVNVIRTSTTKNKPALKTKENTRQKIKHTLNKSQEPIVNFQVNSKRQTISQMSQTRHRYFSKNKGILPYECEPNACVPGQCDPYKCYELMQNRIYKDCSAATVANVRDFATNATPCSTCKSKRIQTGRRRQDGAGIKFMKSVLDHKSRNYVRISSNFGFHIEICKKGDDGPLRDVQVHDDDYKYKKVHSRLHDQASQSKYTRRSQSTFAQNKLQRCFCTKRFFNSSAKAANRGLEYTTNCVLISNVIPTMHNIDNVNSIRESRHFIHTPFYIDNQKKPTKKIKKTIKPNQIFKFRPNTLKISDGSKIKSYFSFDLELYKRKKFKEDDLNKNQRKIDSEHCILPGQKINNLKRLKKLKIIDSISIQGKGDSEKTVDLKRCYSTINLTNKMGLKKEALVDSRKGFKHIFINSNRSYTFHLPKGIMIKWDEVNDHLFNPNKLRFLCNTYHTNKGIFENKILEIQNFNNLNDTGNNEKCSYFQHVYNKLNPYVNKMNFKRFFKNMKHQRQSDKIAATIR